MKALEKQTTLTQQQLETVAEYAQEKRYNKGDYFLKFPKVSTEIGFVLSGVLRYYYLDDEGNEVTAMFMQANDFFTDLKSFQNRTPSSGFIQAETDAKVLVFDAQANETLLGSVDGWALALRQITQSRLLEQLQFSRSLINDDALGAYKSFISTYPEIANSVTDRHLASFLGISKYTFSRIKNQVKKD